MAQRVVCTVTPAMVTGSEVKADSAIHKTIAVTIDGSGTVDVMCRVGTGATQSDSLIGSQLTATGRVDTTAVCDTIYLKCGGATPPTISGWIRQIPGD
jgi:hypothetical protein